MELDSNSSKSLYIQIYENLRGGISTGEIVAGEKLPSVRSMAEMLGVSITTVRAAYDQLTVEGYLICRPQSGFYVSEGAMPLSVNRDDGGRSSGSEADSEGKSGVTFCDPETFDFVKWKKCMASVLNESPERLLSIGDRQGEKELREEIASYLYSSRGVICSPEEIVISAGTQQLMDHLSRILKIMDIRHVCTEDPGYMPVRSIFREHGFGMSHIPVADDGIVIEKLPINIRTAVYISPQNQFPTGAVMPIGRRHEILNWARTNDSIIIEDDYDSELRYQGQPVPALQGLDNGCRVVYLGSFTSTLFPAVRISYMVLPRDMAEIYRGFKTGYDQTCSKTEQLTLALFMQRGSYQINLRKIRNLYSRKLRELMKAVRMYGSDGFMTVREAASGMNIILSIDTHPGSGTDRSGAEPGPDTATDDITDKLIGAAERLGHRIYALPELGKDGVINLNFYYNQIPIDEMNDAVRELSDVFRRIIEAY